MAKTEKPLSNRKVNKSVMFTEEEAEAVESFLRRLAVKEDERVTFSSWAHGVLLEAMGKALKK